ncbi:MAG: hypothetical protein LBN34_07385 [Clostridiales Family XIII bacterium]|jgi:O-acetylhomoserine/O-acetylserine sulfhydrylase-like pyridoxal-dependent enzyme|nr:hypothetical protein [Clostridiales Family XIII bacterium]
MKIETLCIHPESGIDNSARAIATPIYQTSTFQHKDIDGVGDRSAVLFSGKK